MYTFGVIGRYIRAMLLIAALYIVAHGCEKYWNRNKLTQMIRNLLFDCSRFSMQLYLFNGYLLTAIRIVVCQVLSIRSPLVIVLTIWIGNLVITLIACKWVIPKIPVLKNICGLV